MKVITVSLLCLIVLVIGLVVLLTGCDISKSSNKEDIHREREQAYMCGYEDGSRKYRTEQSEDAISRQEVINAIYGNGFCGYEYNLTASRIKKAVEKLPSVNTTETAEWHVDDFTGLIKCSKCDNDAPMSTNSGEQYNSKFCPSCGAKMESEGKE